MTNKLTAKRKRFVKEYIIDLNGTQAAIRAGFSAKTARKIASNLLTLVDIKTAIQDAKKARNERTEIDQDFVTKQLLQRYELSNRLQVTVDKENKPEQYLNEKHEWVDKVNYVREDGLRILETMARHVGYFDKDKSGSGVTVIIGEKDIGTL